MDPSRDIGTACYPELLDLMFEGAYCVDLDRNITHWNRAAEQLTGYRKLEVMGRPCHDNILVHTDATGEQLCHTRCPMVVSMAEGTQQEAEVFLLHRTGQRVAVRVRTAPLRNEAGQIVGGVEVFRPA